MVGKCLYFKGEILFQLAFFNGVLVFVVLLAISIESLLRELQLLLAILGV
jgi:hypothetical protein